MHVVNTIVAADALKIKTKFSGHMDKYFSSKILAMDWTKVDEICKAANEFCNDSTNGRISNILSPGKPIIFYTKMIAQITLSFLVYCLLQVIFQSGHQ